MLKLFFDSMKHMSMSGLVDGLGLSLCHTITRVSSKFNFSNSVSSTTQLFNFHIKQLFPHAFHKNSIMYVSRYPVAGFVCEVLVCANYASCCRLANFNSAVTHALSAFQLTARVNSVHVNTLSYVSVRILQKSRHFCFTA